MSSLLVVDDSKVDRCMVTGLLHAAGYTQVELASDGNEALEKIRQNRPHLVITDLLMPRLDGLELVRTVASEFPGMPVVLMTGCGSEEVAVRALRAGAASYVPKRSLATLLVETVEKLLAISCNAESSQRLLAHQTYNECEFCLGNDLALVPPLIHYLRNCMLQIGLRDEATGIRVAVALEEAIMNAIFHGNLELSSDVRELDHDLYNNMLKNRRQTAPYRDRTVRVRARFSRLGAEFIIRDQGPGFNPLELPDPTDPANLERACGRGVLLMRTFMDNVEYNASGNEVTMKKSLCHCDAAGTP